MAEKTDLANLRLFSTQFGHTAAALQISTWWASAPLGSFYSVAILVSEILDLVSAKDFGI